MRCSTDYIPVAVKAVITHRNHLSVIFWNRLSCHINSLPTPLIDNVRSNRVAEDQQTEAIRVQLAEQHQAAFGWALGCCNGDAAQAEEVLQCSYLKILEGKARFGEQSSFKTWLFGVIRCTASEHRRRLFLQTLRFVKHSDEGQISHSDEDMAEQVQRQQLQRRFREGLTTLPRRQREVMQLVLAHELTLQEASVVMGISVGSVRQHYQRGKQRLRIILGKLETT